MKYDVHIYAVYRVKIEGVEADSQLDAVREAEILFCQYPHRYPAIYTEDYEEALVDEHGDDEFSHSTYYKHNGKDWEVTP